MAAIALILALAFGGAHYKLDAKPCDSNPKVSDCKHPAFK